MDKVFDKSDKINDVNDNKTKEKPESSKHIEKKCKILYWNKISKTLAFNYDGICVQVKTDKDIKQEKFINVLYKDEKYEIL